MSVEDQVSLLHVDDDPELGPLVKACLEREASGIDCSVTTARSPERALELVGGSGGAFDCVVSDYSMPQMDGIELLEAVREVAPERPVLLFSGEETSDIAGRDRLCGVTDYLRRGFGDDQYAMLIRRVSHAVEPGGRFDPEVETAVDGAGIVGNGEQFEDADEAYASLDGYTAEEIRGKHPAELHLGGGRVRPDAHPPVVRDGGRWTGRSEGLRADDSTFTEAKMVTATDDGRLLIAGSEFDGATAARSG